MNILNFYLWDVFVILKMIRNILNEITDKTIAHHTIKVFHSFESEVMKDMICCPMFRVFFSRIRLWEWDTSIKNFGSFRLLFDYYVSI